MAGGWLVKWYFYLFFISNSAEINGLKTFLEQRIVKKIYLICTDTNFGKLCVNILEDYLRGVGITDITFKEAKWFGTENFEQGLLEIRNTVLKLIKTHKKTL